MTHVFPRSFSLRTIHSALFALLFRYASGYGARPTRILYVGDFCPAQGSHARRPALAQNFRNGLVLVRLPKEAV